MGQNLIDKFLVNDNVLKKILTASVYHLNEQNIKVWSDFQEITLTVVWFLLKVSLKC